MDIKTYNCIVSFIKNFNGSIRDCKININKQFPNIEILTLYSIIQTEVMKKSKSSFHRLPKVLNSCLTEYRNLKNSDSFKKTDGILANLAKKYDISPIILAREILKKDQNVEDSSLNFFIKDTTQIKDSKLAYEVFLCVIADVQSGPITDLIKQNFGVEYEIRLEAKLRQLGVCFQTETELKAIGYDKTPDFRLLIPLSINGFIINWIESKAIFGCEQMHNVFYNKQYFSYYNRFGPGMIIYWFGYIKSIENVSQKFILTDRFPDDFVSIP